METLQTKLEKEQATIDRKRKLLEAFPDLIEDVDRWNTVRLSSKLVNSQVTDFELRNSCGCCNDSIVLALPYLEFEGQRIYSNPARFRIGQNDPHTYTKDFFDGWQKELMEAGIANCVLVGLEAIWARMADKKVEMRSIEEKYR